MERLLGDRRGGALMFLSSYLVGVFVWGKYMPEVFLGTAFRFFGR